MRRKNVFKAYFCAFRMRMRGPWYVTKRLFASFATAIFQKICRPPHGLKHKYGMGGPTLRELRQKMY